MKLMTCPLNGPRNISEFACAGELVDSPDPRTLSDEAWADVIFLANNTAGVVREWWVHVASSYWFIAERNTVTDEIIRTYPASELFKERVVFAAEGGERT
jgi:sarcosine oxidase subunit delta